MLGLQNRLILENRALQTPISEKVQLHTKNRVWNLLISQSKVGNGSRGVVWKASGKTEGSSKEIQGVVKEYITGGLQAMDQKTPEEVIERNLRIHGLLKKSGIKTIPTLRKINDYSVFMTDLTEGGKYELITIAGIHDGIKLLRGGSLMRRLQFLEKAKIRDVLIGKLKELDEQMRKAEIKMDRNALDGVFIRFKKGLKKSDASSIELLLVDLDNIVEVKEGEKGGLGDPIYYADLFLKILT